MITDVCMFTIYHEMKRIVIKKYVLCMFNFCLIRISTEKIVQSNCMKWQSHIVLKQGNTQNTTQQKPNLLPLKSESMHITVELFWWGLRVGQQG